MTKTFTDSFNQRDQSTKANQFLSLPAADRRDKPQKNQDKQSSRAFSQQYAKPLQPPYKK